MKNPVNKKYLFIAGGLLALAVLLYKPAIKTAKGALMNRASYLARLALHPEYKALFSAAEVKHGLPAGMLSAIAYIESRYNPKAKSPVGAMGLMQIMPGTAEDIGKRLLKLNRAIDPYNPAEAINAAAVYLVSLKKLVKTWSKSAAAYNAGPGRIMGKEFPAWPLETRNYYTNFNTLMGGAI